MLDKTEGKYKMKLPPALSNKIVEFLSSIPNIYNNNMRQALIFSAGLDQRLQDQITFTGPPASFFPMLVTIVIQYGTLEDGRHALEAVLESAKNYVGQDRKGYCETLIQEFRAVQHPETSRVKLVLDWIIGVFLIVLVILLLLAAFIKKDNNLVQLELTVRNVSFHFLSSEGGLLFNSLPVNTIQFVHFEKFSIPFAQAEVAADPLQWMNAGENGELTMLSSDSYSSIIFEDIRLSELNLRRGSRVTLSVPEVENQVIRIIVDKFPTEGRIIIGDAVRIECQYCKFNGITDQSEKELKYVRVFNTASHEIGFQSKGNLFLASIELPETTNLSERNIYVENVSFLEGSGRYLRTSVVKLGKIIFKELNNKEVRIESHDFIEIGRAENLQITRITFQNDEIKLVLVGRIDELKTGAAKEDLTDWTPSYLEWIRHKQPWALFMGALLWIIGLIKEIKELFSIISKLFLKRSRRTP